MIRITTLDRLITVLSVMKGNILTYQTEVGATPADITFINETLANLEYLQEYADSVDASKKAVFQIKQSAFNGVPDETIPPFPVFAAGVPPFALLSGYLERTVNMIRRFILGPGYTHEIGVALGFEGDGTSAPNPNPKPDIEVFSAQTGAMFSCVVSKRADSDQWTVQILRSGSTQWQNVGTFTGKAADVSVTLTNPGQPEQIQVRVQLRKSNQNHGIVSDAAYVTVNP